MYPTSQSLSWFLSSFPSFQTHTLFASSLGGHAWIGNTWGIFTNDGKMQKFAPLLRDVWDVRCREAGSSMNSLQSAVTCSTVTWHFRSRQGVTGRLNLGTNPTVHIYCIIKEIYEKDKDMDRKYGRRLWNNNLTLMLQYVQERAVGVSTVSFQFLDTGKPKSFSTGVLQALSLGSSSPLWGSTTFPQLLDLYKREERKGWWVCMATTVTVVTTSLCFALLHLKYLKFLSENFSLKTIVYLWRNRDATVTAKLRIQLHHHQAEASRVDPGLSLRFQAVNDIKNTQNSI